MSDIHVNLYEILEVSEDANISNIQKAYYKMVKKYHPDKSKIKNKKEAEEIYELITHAYNVLSDENQRKQYDHAVKLSNEAVTSHNALRGDYDTFIKAQENWADEDEKNKLTDEAYKKFLLENALLNEKHGYDSEDVDAITSDEFNKRLNDLRMAREQEKIEIIPDPICDPKNFNHSKFNIMWNQVHGQGPMDIIKKNNPTAFNNVGSRNNEFVGIGNNDLYDETNPDNLLDDNIEGGYASINFGKELNISANDYNAIDLDDDNDYDNHNKITTDFENEVERRMKEYEQETGGYKDMKFNNFKNDDLGEFGISNQLGFETNNIDWKALETDNIENKYKKLLKFREDKELKKLGKKEKKDEDIKIDKKKKKKSTKEKKINEKKLIERLSKIN